MKVQGSANENGSGSKAKGDKNILIFNKLGKDIEHR